MNLRKIMRSKSGFTLVECIVSLAVIAIISGTAIVITRNYNSAYDNNKEQYLSRVLADNSLEAFKFAENEGEFRRAIGIAADGNEESDKISEFPTGETVRTYDSLYYDFKKIVYNVTQKYVALENDLGSDVFRLDHSNQTDIATYLNEHSTGTGATLTADNATRRQETYTYNRRYDQNLLGYDTTGGTVTIDINSGRTTAIIQDGQFSSPLYYVNGKFYSSADKKQYEIYHYTTDEGFFITKTYHHWEWRQVSGGSAVTSLYNSVTNADTFIKAVVDAVDDEISKEDGCPVKSGISDAFGGAHRCQKEESEEGDQIITYTYKGKNQISALTGKYADATFTLLDPKNDPIIAFKYNKQTDFDTALRAYNESTQFDDADTNSYDYSLYAKTSAVIDYTTAQKAITISNADNAEQKTVLPFATDADRTAMADLMEDCITSMDLDYTIVTHEKAVRRNTGAVEKDADTNTESHAVTVEKTSKGFTITYVVKGSKSDTTYYWNGSKFAKKGTYTTITTFSLDQLKTFLAQHENQPKVISENTKSTNSGSWIKPNYLDTTTTQTENFIRKKVNFDLTGKFSVAKGADYKTCAITTRLQDAAGKTVRELEKATYASTADFRSAQLALNQQLLSTDAEGIITKGFAPNSHTYTFDCTRKFAMAEVCLDESAGYAISFLDYGGNEIYRFDYETKNDMEIDEKQLKNVTFKNTAYFAQNQTAYYASDADGKMRWVAVVYDPAQKTYTVSYENDTGNTLLYCSYTNNRSKTVWGWLDVQTAMDNAGYNGYYDSTVKVSTINANLSQTNFTGQFVKNCSAVLAARYYVPSQMAKLSFKGTEQDTNPASYTATVTITAAVNDPATQETQQLEIFSKKFSSEVTYINATVLFASVTEVTQNVFVCTMGNYMIEIRPDFDLWEFHAYVYDTRSVIGTQEDGKKVYKCIYQLEYAKG